MEATKSPAMESTEAAAAVSAAMKSAEPATERRRVIGSNGEADDDRRAGQQHARQVLPVPNSAGHRRSPDYLGFALATAGKNGIFSVPGGRSGVNTGSAILGAKFQSVKVAVNCGWPGCVL